MFCTEFQGAVVVAASQFNGGRLTFQIKDREVKVGLGVLLIEFDRFAHFLFGAF